MEGTENLGFNMPALLIQIISFLVLLGLLYFAAYRPIMRRVNKRSQAAKVKAEQLEKELAGMGVGIHAKMAGVVDGALLALIVVDRRHEARARKWLAKLGVLVQ